MASHSIERKRELIEAVVKQAKGRIEGKTAKDAERFVRAFYANVPPDDILGETPENLAGAALSIWGFAAERRTGEAKIRLYNPRSGEEGWESSHTAVEIVNDDMPFLVDSVTAEINRNEAEVILVIHPILMVERDEKGRMVSLALPDDPKAEGRTESMMLVFISEQPESRHRPLAEGLTKVLADVRSGVEDWRAMRLRCRDVIRELEKTPPKLPREEIAEGIAFLEWLDDDHFTYLGFREYRFEGKGARLVARIDPRSGLGLLRNPEFSVFDGLRNLGKLPPDVQAWIRTPELLRISKANRRSTVHRPTHMDAIAVKTFNARGEVTGERLFIGLFTSTAYSKSPRAIPLLRRKVDRSIARAGFVPGSHDGKALLHILENYPRDELFQISENELADTAIGILHLQERQRTALFARRDPFGRFVSCMVYVPRDRFDTRLRLRLQQLLSEAYGGEVSSFSTQVGDSPLARLHVIVRTEQGKFPEVDTAALEERLVEASRSWADLLTEALILAEGEERGLTLARRYAQAFPSNYQESFSARDAVADIRCIEQALASRSFATDLYRPLRAAPDQMHFKIYVAGQQVPLSDVMPVLEHMGLKVIGEVPFEVHPAAQAASVWIHDFDLRLRSAAREVAPLAASFQEVFRLVWTGEMEDDGFNRLVLAAGLTAREIRILRAYCKYLRQAGIPFSQDYMEDTLAGNQALAAALAELFMLRFDPAPRTGKAGDRPAAVEAKVAEIHGLLDQVANLDEDRIIRRYLNLVLSTLRTSYFQKDHSGAIRPYVSFKFDAGALEELPQPRPYREVFVYSPRFEGVHLRFGAVARGGIRWSDRREDFRTEILGLVKAQRVKNAVIVPVGSKGGFVPKRLPPPEAGREALQAEGVACYRTFLSGLLDITDNLVNGKVAPPRDTLRYDGDDPYLVVAADKGTATFSDVANAVSADYGFWLDDAFASGGSAGYDHKAMGITARGAWESVKRHFREIGKDIQAEDFTVVGVGDMSGDVFGNGMLLSPHIRLIGAFNHLHIFVDPSPDPKVSFAERKRLFSLPRSSWSDYQAKLISKGGGVFDRKAKSIKVTPEMRAALDIAADSLTPAELVRAMLRAPVELLWFGGIGTYVKASDESHLEVGDRSNDALRVEGRELRAKVVGEGANLGMTQRGRVEYALAGGRLNTDAIDNSGGVDCSDHEVNIKILLGAVERAGKLKRPARDRLLAEMTGEVAALVLRDNYLQSQSISVTHHLGAHLLDRMGRFMRALEKAGKLDRAIEFLPDDEAMTERAAAKLALTRPELAVLLSYAKISLYEEILASDLPDDPWLAGDLLRYFPEPLQRRYPREIAAHRLSREITATQVTNGMVNRMGIPFVHEVREKTGMPASEVARAYLAAREVFEMRSLWSEIEALDAKVQAATQYAMLVECGRLTERTAVWFLRNLPTPLPIAETVERFAPDARRLAAGLTELLHAADRRSLEEEVAKLVEDGVPQKLAVRIASLKQLVPACDIVEIAQAVKLPVLEVAAVYLGIGARFGFDWLRRAASRLPSDSAWDKLAITAIVDDLYGYQAQLAARVLERSGRKAAGLAEAIDRWAEARRPQVARSEQLLYELQTASAPDLAMLAVANRQLKALVGG